MAYSPFLQAHKADFFEIRAIVLFIKCLHSSVRVEWGGMFRQGVGNAGVWIVFPCRLCAFLVMKGYLCDKRICA